MNTCMDCGQKYERTSGIMICVCTNCLNKPRPPYVEPYLERGRLFVPNPEAKK